MAIDTEDTKASLFGNLKKQATSQAEIRERSKIESFASQPIPKDEGADPGEDTDSPLPKWQQLDRVTVLLTPEQKEGMDRIAKRLMKFRAKETKGKKEKERITANTLIRALINLVIERETSLELAVIETEEDAMSWIAQLFK